MSHNYLLHFLEQHQQSSCFGSFLQEVRLGVIAADARSHAQIITANKSEPIPVDQIGTVAGKHYQGDGLSVTATPDGARLRCVFQRMEGRATSEGLWLTSTGDQRGERPFPRGRGGGGARDAFDGGRPPHPVPLPQWGRGCPQDGSGGAPGHRRSGGPGQACAVHSPRFGGGILREPGRGAAGFCGGGKAAGHGRIAGAAGRGGRAGGICRCRRAWKWWTPEPRVRSPGFSR